MNKARKKRPVFELRSIKAAGKARIIITKNDDEFYMCVIDPKSQESPEVRLTRATMAKLRRLLSPSSWGLNAYKCRIRWK